MNVHHRRAVDTWRWIITTALAALLVLSAVPAAAQSDEQTDVPGVDTTLRQAAPDGFRFGTAVAGGGHHEEQDYPAPFPNDDTYRTLLAGEFNSLTPENQMKWEFIHPEPDEYNFGPADNIVAFANDNDQVVRGHTLMWHSQNPAWLEEGDYTAEELRDILEDHVTTVVSHFAGDIYQWDVANEVFDDEGNYRLEENIWLRELGTDIIADVFRWAHAADPDALLFLNDYNVEGANAKSDAYYGLIQELLADGVPVHGFGAQAHFGMQYGIPGDIEENLQRFADLGLETAITELDVRMILPDDGVPTDEQLAQQAEWYRRTLQACLDVDSCNSFTIWGFTDKYSWVPVFFEDQGGGTIMWDDFDRKPAYFSLRSTLATANTTITQRVSGQNRYGTASVIATSTFPDGVTDVVLASGEAYPDALTGAGVAGTVSAPVLLTRSAALSPEARAALQTLGAETVHIIGGTDAVSQTVEDALDDEGYDTPRIEGGDRYETAAEVALAIGAENVAASTALIATGENYPDAVAGGPLAYAGPHPILLVDTEVPQATEDALRTLGITDVIVLGGITAVSEDVADELATLTGDEDVVRLGGETRIDTAAAIAGYAVDEAGFDLSTVLVANGWDNMGVDALAGGPHGGVGLSPILLVDDDELPAGSQTLLADNCDSVEVVRGLGGPSVIAESTLEAANAAAECAAEDS